MKEKKDKYEIWGRHISEQRVRKHKGRQTWEEADAELKRMMTITLYDRGEFQKVWTELEIKCSVEWDDLLGNMPLIRIPGMPLPPNTNTGYTFRKWFTPPQPVVSDDDDDDVFDLGDNSSDVASNSPNP